MVGSRVDAAHPTAGWGLQGRKEAVLHSRPPFPLSFLLSPLLTYFLPPFVLKSFIEPLPWFKYFARTWVIKDKITTVLLFWQWRNQTGELAITIQWSRFSNREVKGCYGVPCPVPWRKEKTSWRKLHVNGGLIYHSSLFFKNFLLL